VIGLLLALALPPLELALEVELELLELPHAAITPIATSASPTTADLRKILISVSSAPQ
jgi:hypothetical protein